MDKASASDVDFLTDGIQKAAEVFPDKPEAVHADGAYHSPYNQDYCKDNDIDLFLHAIQGAKGRYRLDQLETGELSIFDTVSNKVIDSLKIKSKDGVDKWRIKTEKGYRYFTQKDIDVHLLRKQIKQTPIETLQKRNNVEATILQLGYHYSNAKSRYRGQIKHQMWANIRCLWVNFVRILNYMGEACPKTRFFTKLNIKLSFFALYTAFKSLLRQILSKNRTIAENCSLSLI